MFFFFLANGAIYHVRAKKGRLQNRTARGWRTAFRFGVTFREAEREGKRRMGGTKVVVRMGLGLRCVPLLYITVMY